MRIADFHVCFSHGKESGPWGHKIAAMAELARSHGASVDSVDYRGMPDPGARVEKLIACARTVDGPLVLVGSSMGGHVAAAASRALSPAGLFLIAPAFYMPGYEDITPVPEARLVSIVHGWGDEVVPADNSVRWASRHGAELHLLRGDHRLTDRIDAINRLFDGFLHELADA